MREDCDALTIRPAPFSDGDVVVAANPVVDVEVVFPCLQVASSVLPTLPPVVTLHDQCDGCTHKLQRRKAPQHDGDSAVVRVEVR
eukprot:COSAG02_NODE_978_length_15497_cov_11.288349_12_plen_85_part_00